MKSTMTQETDLQDWSFDEITKPGVYPDASADPDMMVGKLLAASARSEIALRSLGPVVNTQNKAIRALRSDVAELKATIKGQRNVIVSVLLACEVLIELGQRLGWLR